MQLTDGTVEICMQSLAAGFRVSERKASSVFTAATVHRRVQTCYRLFRTPENAHRLLHDSMQAFDSWLVVRGFSCPTGE